MKKEEVINFIHHTAIIDSDVKIGHMTKIWHFAHISKGAKIGDCCIIGDNVFIGRNVVIGNNCKIQNGAFIPTGVIIEDNVFIGPNVVFTNVRIPRAFIEKKEEFEDTRIMEGASIGANATIVCGITIGSYALIGAGTVLTQDVQDFEVVVGNPGKVIGETDKEGSGVIYSVKD